MKVMVSFSKRTKFYNLTNVSWIFDTPTDIVILPVKAHND